MSVSPSSINLSYTQFSGNTPSQGFSVQPNVSDISQVGFTGVPSWLNITLQSITTQGPAQLETYNYIATVVPNQANNLQPGDYQANPTIQVLYGTNQQLNFNLNVNLEVIFVQQLDVSPTEIVHNLLVGDPNPPDTTITVLSEGQWSVTKNKPWISLSQTNGDQNDIFQVSVDIQGLPEGNYSGQVIVDDGDQAIINVTLNLQGDNVGQQYMIVTPEQVQFSENQAQTPVGTHDAVVDSSLDTSITTDVSWLAVSASSFTSGTNVLTISTQNTEGLGIGTYLGKVTVTSAIGSEDINCLLLIINPNNSGLDNNTLYFANARNELQLFNAQDNAEAIFENKFTLANGDQKLIKAKVPYFQNKINKIIGLETNLLLKGKGIINVSNNAHLNMLRPLDHQLNVSDKQIGQSAQTPRVVYFGLKFLNGKKPEDVLTRFPQDQVKQELPTGDLKYRLTHLPEVIYAPANALILLSYYSDDAAQNTSVVISSPGSLFVTDTIVANNDSKVHTIKVDLSTYDLSKFDKVTIDTGFIKTTVKVTTEHTPEDTKIIWENQWNCLECFNASGAFEINPETDEDEATYSKQGRTVNDIFNIEERKNFTVNTGAVYTMAEIRQLKSLLNARRIWLVHDGITYEVLRDFDDLDTFKTFRNINIYDLDFVEKRSS